MDRIWPLDEKGPKTYEKSDAEWWAEMKKKQALVDKKLRQRHGR